MRSKRIWACGDASQVSSKGEGFRDLRRNGISDAFSGKEQRRTGRQRWHAHVRTSRTDNIARGLIVSVMHASSCRAESLLLQGFARCSAQRAPCAFASRGHHAKQRCVSAMSPVKARQAHRRCVVLSATTETNRTPKVRVFGTREKSGATQPTSARSAQRHALRRAAGQLSIRKRSRFLPASHPGERPRPLHVSPVFGLR